jgi:signal peptidase I
LDADVLSKKIKKFFFPPITRHYVYRIVLVAIGVYLFFKFVCLPFKIQGQSMEPTYKDSGFNFCFKQRYFFSEPKRGDVVTVRLAGEKVMLLKRIIAVEGDTLAFEDGKLYLNGEQVDEAYVKYPSDWDLAERNVKKGYVYVVGDNRSVPVYSHRFGQTPLKRIVGGPLW